MAKPLNYSKNKLHSIFVSVLRDSVIWHSDVKYSPLEVDLKPPLPNLIRLYLYNATRPPGGRTLGEHKIQLMVFGQKKGELGRFNNTDNRIVLLAGYQPEDEVFILWDAGFYPTFTHSRNIQVKSETIIFALAGMIGKQNRRIRGMRHMGEEVVLTATSKNLEEAIMERMRLTCLRLTKKGS